jgi:hypothetical protein
MRNILAALAVGTAALGFAISAQAAPASLAPLTTLNQSSIEQVQYRPKCGYGQHSVRVCKGYGYERKCYYVCKKDH